VAIFRNAPKERRDEDRVLSASKSFVPVPGYCKGSLTLPDGDHIPYLALGDGPLPVIYIPGADDILTTVIDAALWLAFYFRKHLSSYRMLLIRRQPIPHERAHS
jgi:hypothetical protein